MNGDEAGALRLEAYAIVSADGMLADASGVMPEELKFAADQRYFENRLYLALARFSPYPHRIAIIGGSAAFEQFLDRYDCFHLSRASGVRLPGGRPIFCTVPPQTPEEVLARHGLFAGPVMVLDAARAVTTVNWSRRPLS